MPEDLGQKKEVSGQSEKAGNKPPAKVNLELPEWLASTRLRKMLNSDSDVSLPTKKGLEKLKRVDEGEIDRLLIFGC